ncbi:MAG: hypothetical protein HYZ00_06275 [Candidatus Hydrogenedentes bacterium]|nr:hypothetical protein [Candidatus Hydrogenedentota bacterium]
MPGILGVVSSDPEMVQSCLGRMIPPLLHRPWYEVQSVADSGCALACVSLDDRMGVAREGGTLLTFHGEISNRAALLERLPQMTHPEAGIWPLARLLLHVFLRHGVQPLQRLNGYFALALWEGTSRRLTIITDRGGCAKVHYWRRGGLFLFAPESKAIVWHPAFNKTLDELGFYELLCLTYLLDDRTLFRDIRLVPPAHVLTCTPDSLACTRYWNHEIAPAEDPAAPLERYADGYYERLREAVRRRLPESTTGVLLTGGLDSRVLAGLMRQEDPHATYHSITTSDPAGHDAKFAVRIARVSRFQHHFIRVGADYLPRYAPEAIRRIEGLATAHICWSIASDTLVEELELRFLFDGYLGCGNVHPAFPEDSNPDQAFRLLLERAFAGFLAEERFEGLVKPHILRAARGVSLQQLRAQYDSLEGHDPAARNEILRRDQEHRRFIGVGSELQGALSRLLYPYDDHEVWEYLLAIPMPYRRGKQFFLELIRRHFPALAAIPRSGTAVPIGGSPGARLFHRARQRFYHRILPGLSGGRYGGRNLEKGMFYTEWQRTGSRRFILEMIAKTELYEDVIEVDEAQRRISSHLEGRTTDDQLVHVLLAFILWREHFCRP